MSSITPPQSTAGALLSARTPFFMTARQSAGIGEKPLAHSVRHTVKTSSPPITGITAGSSGEARSQQPPISSIDTKSGLITAETASDMVFPPFHQRRRAAVSPRSKAPFGTSGRFPHKTAAKIASKL
jgi:hypothetical protein